MSEEPEVCPECGSFQVWLTLDGLRLYCETCERTFTRKVWREVNWEDLPASPN